MRQLIIAALFCFYQSSVALAYPMPMPQSLRAIVEASDVIIVGEITDFSPDNEDNLLVVGKDGKKTIDFEGIKKREGERGLDLILSRLQSPGTHNLQVIEIAKGEIKADQISLHTPQITSVIYGSNEFKVGKGNRVIAFFKKTQKATFEVSDQYLFFVPLSKKVAVQETEKLNLESRIRQLMIQTLQEKEYPETMLYLLRDEKSVEIVKAASQFAKDANSYLRDKALYSLAVNQQISVIPLIVEQAEKHDKDYRVPASCVGALSNFSSAQALPAIELLVLNKSYLLRYRAVSTVRPIANKNSVPILLLSLLDPDPQQVIPSSSAFTLSQVTGLPILNESNGHLKDPKAAFQKFLSWWQDELSGKHPAAKDEEPPRVTLRESNLYEAKDLPRLNEGLFMRSEFTRGAAIKALDKLADQSSIPYLLLAQYDPKPDIAFGAYQTLHRLIPELGAAKTRASFDAGRDALAQEGLDWWVKSLRDNLPAEMKQQRPAAAPPAMAGK